MRDKLNTLLLVTHVAIRQGPSGPQIDDQTAAGIAQWCKHFDEVTYYGISIDPMRQNGSSAAWVDINSLPFADKCKVIALPRAYGIVSMLREYFLVRKNLADAVFRHTHLCFTFGGLVGDWPAVAARQAIRQNRSYAAWIDRVEPDVIRNKMAGASLKYRILGTAALPLITSNINHLLRKSFVALLQGMDTFEHYAALSNDPHCTYDTHTHVSDQISPQSLAIKQRRILNGEAINILYVGRAAAMKGPDDWLGALERLHQLNIPFKATWIGDGPELSAMRQRINASGLAGAIRLHGFENDREVLLKAMRDSDIFMYCHKTAESPRCLVEALVSGAPLVGYETAYSRGLVKSASGAAFVPRDDFMALADRIAVLHRDRTALAKLVADAATSGELYNEDAVYAHRANLMKRA